jgi:hypothetical protein
MGTLHESTGDRGELVADSCVGCHDQENSPDFDPVSYMERIRHW